MEKEAEREREKEREEDMIYVEVSGASVGHVVCTVESRASAVRTRATLLTRQRAVRTYIR